MKTPTPHFSEIPVDEDVHHLQERGFRRILAGEELGLLGGATIEMSAIDPVTMRKMDSFQYKLSKMVGYGLPVTIVNADRNDAHVRSGLKLENIWKRTDGQLMLELEEGVLYQVKVITPGTSTERLVMDYSKGAHEKIASVAAVPTASHQYQTGAEDRFNVAMAQRNQIPANAPERQYMSINIAPFKAGETVGLYKYDYAGVKVNASAEARGVLQGLIEVGKPAFLSLNGKVVRTKLVTGIYDRGGETAIQVGNSFYQVRSEGSPQQPQTQVVPTGKKPEKESVGSRIRGFFKKVNPFRR